MAVLSLLAGCTQVSFEPIDRRGHVRIEREGSGYCFKIPQEWEIREKLEGADVACMGPLKDNFRETIVVKSLGAASLDDPERFIKAQLESKEASIAFKSVVLEHYTEERKPVTVTFEAGSISDVQTGQLLYLREDDKGEGVLFTCTTRATNLESRREFFQKIVDQAKFDLSKCEGVDGVPESFPTPTVTYTPSP